MFFLYREGANDSDDIDLGWLIRDTQQAANNAVIASVDPNLDRLVRDTQRVTNNAIVASGDPMHMPTVGHSVVAKSMGVCSAVCCASNHTAIVSNS